MAAGVLADGPLEYFARARPLSAQREALPGATVETKSGKVRGSNLGKVQAFRGRALWRHHRPTPSLHAAAPAGQMDRRDAIASSSASARLSCCRPSTASCRRKSK